MKKIGFISLITIVLLILLIFLGYGPRPDIPENVKPGQEYKSSGEESIARATSELVLNSIKERYASQTLMKRDAHPHAHGCVRGGFRINSVTDPALRGGLFKTPAEYKVWIRYSNGGTKPKADIEGDIRGMGIKLMGVPGEKIQTDEKLTQDFLLISNPVLPAGEPAEYLALFRAALKGKPMSYFFGGAPWNWKLRALGIVKDIRSLEVPGVHAIRYWSTVPYKLGAAAVKYSVRPCKKSQMKMPADPSRYYLRENLKTALEKGNICLKFMVQFQKDPVKMPVEDSSVVWNEAESPFIEVAEINIPPQKFDTPAQNKFCEELTFNPWHSLPAHRPLGGINRVRKIAYDTIAKYRLEKNKVKRTEPDGNERF